MRHPQGTQAFTLMELLIAVALGALLLLVLSEVLVSSSRSATDLQGRNELQEDSQIAQNYAAGQLREAAYVFPPGATLTLGSGVTTRRPGGGSWVVGGAAPIVAFVRPPQRPAATRCEDGGCYQFMAYYPVLRSTWVGGVSGQNNPGQDSTNGDRWVLVEYRSNYPYGTRPTLTALAVRPYVPPASGSSGRLLLDYVQPATLAPAGAPPLFQVNDLSVAPTPAWTQAPGNISVTVNLTVSRMLGGRLIIIPARTATTPPLETVTAVAVAPRNLGRLPN